MGIRETIREWLTNTAYGVSSQRKLGKSKAESPGSGKEGSASNCGTDEQHPKDDAETGKRADMQDIVREWITDLMIAALRNCVTEKDREEVLDFLRMAKKIAAYDKFSFKEKLDKLYFIMDTKKAAGIFLRGVGESFRSYKDSDLPTAVKLAIPATLGGAAVVGGQGVGIAAFGGAVGVPAVLLIFIGAAGIGTVIDAFVKDPSYVRSVMALIVADEAYRRCRKHMRDIMTSKPAEPRRFEVPEEEQALREKLLSMDPFDFERHVVSFFKENGLPAWVTKKSNDHGVDGFARHPEGLIIIQCKRYAPDNAVGRPTVQQLKGVIEENDAWRGYIATTSYFTREAKKSAFKNSKIFLADMDSIVRWHSEGLSI